MLLATRPALLLILLLLLLHLLSPLPLFLLLPFQKDFVRNQLALLLFAGEELSAFCVDLLLNCDVVLGGVLWEEFFQDEAGRQAVPVMAGGAVLALPVPVVFAFLEGVQEVFADYLSGFLFHVGFLFLFDDLHEFLFVPLLHLFV